MTPLYHCRVLLLNYYQFEYTSYNTFLFQEKTTFNFWFRYTSGRSYELGWNRTHYIFIVIHFKNIWICYIFFGVRFGLWLASSGGSILDSSGVRVTIWMIIE